MKGFDLRLDIKGTIGLVILGAIAFCAVAAPWIAPYDPNAQDLLHTIAPPSGASAAGTGHLLGTDRLGQDILSRIIYGSRISLVIAFASVIGSATVGTVTLAVTPEDAEKLALASADGNIHLVLRNFADSDKVKTVGISMDRLLWPERSAPAPSPARKVVKRAAPAAPPAQPKTYTVEVIKGNTRSEQTFQ